MKKLLFGTILLASIIITSTAAMARVYVSFGIALPSIVFTTPPAMVLIPGTSVYADPDLVDEDLFFWGGWWWCFWQGHWYRSYNYNGGWIYYDNTPAFYFDIGPTWRGHFGNRIWRGERWSHERFPGYQLQRNWHNREGNDHFGRNEHWHERGNWVMPSHQPQQYPHFQHHEQFMSGEHHFQMHERRRK